MIAVHTPYHLMHNPPKEFISNQVAAYGESPERAELILEALMDDSRVQLVRADLFEESHFHKVHSPVYLDYLKNAYEEWVQAGLWSEGILPEFFAIGRLRGPEPPRSPLGKAGYFMTDSCSMIVRGTWQSVLHSGYTALTGARYLLGGEPAVFSLCRPPGHHAGYDFSGGYCFVNNAALAAVYLRDNVDAVNAEKRKVGILDIDFHHGNGTQDIVQRLENVFLVSVHGDPVQAYPYLSGYESENTGKNINIPLPAGITDEEYLAVFRNVIDLLKAYGIHYLVVSLGVDTFEKDDLGDFKLTPHIYGKLSELLIKDLQVPVLIVMEGGYNTEYLAANVMSFLGSFMA